MKSTGLEVPVWGTFRDDQSRHRRFVGVTVSLKLNSRKKPCINRASSAKRERADLPKPQAISTGQNLQGALRALLESKRFLFCKAKARERKRESNLRSKRSNESAEQTYQKSEIDLFSYRTTESYYCERRHLIRTAIYGRVYGFSDFLSDSLSGKRCVALLSVRLHKFSDQR